MERPQPSLAKPSGQSRGKLIFALGILSLSLIPIDIIAGIIIFAGRYSYNKGELFVYIVGLTILIAPILGISVWLMENKDLKKIRDGILPASASVLTKRGKILGILSTFIVPPFVFIIVIFTTSPVTVLVSRDAIINDLKNLSAHSYQYRIRSLEMGGGGGSYEGYKLPQTRGWTENSNAIYTVVAVYQDSLILHGWSKPVEGTIEVKIGPDGQPMETSWIYSGDFK